MRIRALTLMLASSLIAAGDAAAQFDEVLPGARVRLRAPGVVASRYVGTVLDRRADTLFVSHAPGSRVVVATRAITSLEIDRGRSRAAGAKVGAIWGGGIGLISGLMTMEMRNTGTVQDADSIGAASWVTLMTTSYGLVGAGIGAIIGRRHWERFDVAPRVSVLPSRRGALLALSWTH
jgi:hypothetical protein